MKKTLAVLLSMALVLPGCAPRSRTLLSVGPSAGQAPAAAADAAAAWRSFVEKLPPGARVKVVMKNGRTIRGTLLQTTGDAVLVNPRTRVPEPVQTVRLSDVAALELETETTSVARAVGIGIASGVASFFAILFIAIATIDD